MRGSERTERRFVTLGLVGAPVFGGGPAASGIGRLLFILLILIIYSGSGVAQDGANGFYDHGVASPLSNHRGTVATIDATGRNVVLIWLFDHGGTLFNGNFLRRRYPKWRWE